MLVCDIPVQEWVSHRWLSIKYPVVWIKSQLMYPVICLRLLYGNKKLLSQQCKPNYIHLGICPVNTHILEMNLHAYVMMLTQMRMSVECRVTNPGLWAVYPQWHTSFHNYILRCTFHSIAIFISREYGLGWLSYYIRISNNHNTSSEPCSTPTNPRIALYPTIMSNTLAVSFKKSLPCTSFNTQICKVCKSEGMTASRLQCMEPLLLLAWGYWQSNSRHSLVDVGARKLAI